MSTTLLASMQELSKQINDDWRSTSTSTGSTTTIVDTALKAKQNAWINIDAWDMINSGTYDEEERKISSLDNSTGTLTVLAHGGAIASAVSYSVHRLFSASEKREALVWSARNSFPYIHEPIIDETMVSGNWLKDGSFEVWTSSSSLTYWTGDTLTQTQTSTSLYYKHGGYSAKLDTAAGYIEQTISNWDDLKYLAGKHVKFSVQGWCDTASALRIGICYDGTNFSYSSYHDGDSAWTENDDPLEVEYDIDDNPTNIKFRIQLASASATAYVDDARVIAETYASPRLYIADIGFAQEMPVQVFIEPEDYSIREPWILLHNAEVDFENGYLYLPSGTMPDRRLRMKGMGYLDFLASGVSSTSWSATININSPQLDILVANAVVYLYTQKIMPGINTTTKEDYQQMVSYWMSKYKEYKNRFGMPIPPAPVKYK